MPEKQVLDQFVTVSAAPTKRFFVEMLTRDIELHDAILDLLDNCLDGVLRSHGFEINAKQPYKGYWAEITIEQNRFSIRDNCGGISRSLAEKSAFMLGRPDNPELDAVEKEIPTVGVYGIGMKRAIFKMGRSAMVHSQTDREAFTVSIPPKWFTQQDNWKLPVASNARDKSLPNGTRITVERLEPGIKNQFEKQEFAVELRRVISQTYSVIIEKGFAVSVNGSLVLPSPLVFRSVDLKRYKAGIAPYLFKAEIDGVSIDLKIGFYRPSPNEDELEDDTESKSSSHDAGITVICNDRVVLYRDKSRLTGWGEATVPSYHNQFISIAGVISFKCNDSSKLPVTTTKRGIDAGSDVYLQAKDRIRDGLKKFTSFTNRLKLDKKQKDSLFKEAKSVNSNLVDEMSKQVRWKPDQKIKGAKYFSPTLPELERNRTLRWIKYTRTLAEIEIVSEFLFEKRDAETSRVGEECFERVLREAKKA